VHPGSVKTDMTGGKGMLDTETSARGVIERFHELNMKNAGQFLNVDGTKLPW